MPYGSKHAPCGGKLTRLSFAASDPSISTTMTEKLGRGVHRVDDALLYVRMARVCRYIWYGINLCIYTSRVTLLRSLYIKGEQVESGRLQPLLRAGEQAGVYW